MTKEETVMLVISVVLLIILIPLMITQHAEHVEEEQQLQIIYEAIHTKILDGNYVEALAKTEYLHQTSTWGRQVPPPLANRSNTLFPNPWDARREYLISIIKDVVTKEENVTDFICICR